MTSVRRHRRIISSRSNKVSGVKPSAFAVFDERRRHALLLLLIPGVCVCIYVYNISSNAHGKI